MFARLVSIDGHQILVTCCPDTPLSEVLRRAADVRKHRENASDAGVSYYIQYRGE